MLILDEGSVEDRTFAVLVALSSELYELKQTPKYGAVLQPHDARDPSVIIPRDVMEYMISEGLIKFHSLQ